MKRTISLAIISLMLGTVLVAAEPEGVKYGKGVALGQATPIPALVEKPGDFVGKTVRVDGLVTDVCKAQGCWMILAEAEGGKGVRIKVDDGVIVFPMSAKGHRASAEGVFEVIELTPEQAAEHAKHEAEEKGKEGAASTVTPGKNYRVKATGAVVY